MKRRDFLKVAPLLPLVAASIARADVPTREPIEWVTHTKDRRFPVMEGGGYLVGRVRFDHGQYEWYVARASHDERGVVFGMCDYGPWHSASEAMAAVEDGTFRENPRQS